MNPLYIVIAVILVAIIVLTIVYFILRRKKKKAAALAAESEQGAAPGDDEIGVLVRDAEAKLAAAKLQDAKAAHLPVYLLLGDPGSAKTSALVHSGLDAELVAGQVYEQGNITPTRSINIWYTRRSLFVEAGGKLFTETPKWKKLVQRLQPKASVVGKGEQAPRAALVFFDCENFTKPGALEAAAASARGLRTRLGEVCQSFGIRLPVYAVFTKMDRLPFFTEYVRNLSNDEATQVLGVTLPMLASRPEGVYAEEETARIAGNFEGLFRSLADARIEFLPRETDPAKLPSEYEFPREFRKIRQTVVQFLVDLCRPSQLTTGPFLRGFYFSGVRPIIVNETAPVQAATQPQANFGTAAGATGIFSVGSRQAAPAAQQPVVTGTRKVPQWLFLGHFFSDVLLADRSAMGASGSSIKTSGARRILLAAAAALCLLLTFFFTISFFNNRGLENRVTGASNAIGSGEAVGADFASVESLRKLDVLRQSVETLSTYHREGAPFMYRWFLYIGNDLYPEARKVYFARFKQLLFNQTQANDLATLTGLPPTPGPEYQPTYDALKAYLITTSNHDKSTRLFLAPEMMTLWQAGRNADQERQQLAQKQFEFYADELKDRNPFTNENDSAAVEKARRYLANFKGTERVYAFMLSEAAKSNQPIDFNKQFPGSAQTVVETHVVPGAFSKGGWAFMKDALAHADRYFGGEKWVLGDYATANIDPAKLEQDLKSRYYSDFIDQWRAYIKSASVVKYASLKDASAKLTQLSGNQSPLLELMAVASNNTDVDEPTVKSVFQPVQTVVPPGNMDKFVSAPNQNYMLALSALQTSIEAIADKSPPSDQDAAPSIANAQQATGTARQIAQTFRPDRGARPGVDAGAQKLLEDPITYVLGLIRQIGPAELNAKGKDLCAQVRPIMAKYPFKSDSQVQASLADFDSIFEPKKGALWVFYDANLQKLLQRQGSQFVPVSSGGMTVNPAFVAMMNRAGAFTQAAYTNGAMDPHFTYSVKPVMSPDQDSVKMNIDGQSVTFTQSSQAPKPFDWPGKTSGTQASVSYKGTTHEYGFYDGLWSIFLFVQDADKRTGPLVEMTLKSGKSGKVIIDQATGQPVTLTFEIAANPPIFDKGYFSGMACVADVVK